MRKGNQEKEKMLSDQWVQVSEGESQTQPQIHPLNHLVLCRPCPFQWYNSWLIFWWGKYRNFPIKQQMKSSCNRRPHAPVHWMTDPSQECQANALLHLCDRWNVSLSSLSPIISFEIPHPITKGGGYFDLGKAFFKSALLKYSW